MKKTLLLLGAGLWLTACSKNVVHIDKTNVERIVKTLSADDMQGRKTFEPGAAKAAAFIASEFEQTGLQKFQGLSSFEQRFKVYQSSPGSSNVTVNGMKLKEEDYFYLTDKKKVIFNSSTDRREIINKGEVLSQRFEEIRASMKPGQNSIVIIHSSHKGNFARYKSYFEKENAAPRLRVEPASSVLIVLAGEPEKAEVKGEATTESVELQLGNVIGVLPGKSRPDEYVIFSAHYDHIGTLDKTAGDSIANGADDDASGVTAVINLAKHFRTLGNNERTIIFVTFSAEEIGGYGSQYFSRQIDPSKVVAMFNIEMIGKPSKFGKNAAFITGFEKSDFGKILQKNLEGTHFKFHPDPYPQQQLFYRSDNATLARLGVPAHTISSSQIDNDKLYHTVDDEFETLDLTNMAHLINAIAQSATSIIAGKDTPSRIAKADVD